jgi:hypothetical protein
VTEGYTVRAERNTLRAGRNTLRAERNTLRAERNTLRAERNTLRAEGNTVRAEGSGGRIRLAAFERRKVIDVNSPHRMCTTENGTKTLPDSLEGLSSRDSPRSE